MTIHQKKCKIKGVDHESKGTEHRKRKKQQQKTGSVLNSSNDKGSNRLWWFVDGLWMMLKRGKD